MMETENPTHAFTRSVTLPTISLRNAGKPCAVPRRYEETKSVAVQDFSHRRILGIGNDLLKRSLQTFEGQKQDAIRKAEEAVWYQAEQLKRQALREAQDSADVEHEKAIKKLKKMHEKNIKEEALKVELAMQKLSIEQVQLARHEAEIKLNEAIAETKRKANEHLINMVQIARDEEMEAAEFEKKKILRTHADEIKDQRETLLQEKEDEVRDLRDRKDRERKESLEAAIKRERDAADAESKRLRGLHVKDVTALQKDIIEKDTEISSLLRNIEKLQKQKTNIYESLVHTRHEFQKYITRSNSFDREQTECLIPPLYMDELEKI